MVYVPCKKFRNDRLSSFIRGGASRLCAIQIHVYFTYFTFKLNGFEFFRRLCLKVPFGSLKFVFFWGGEWTHKHDLSSTILPKGTSKREKARFEP